MHVKFGRELSFFNKSVSTFDGFQYKCKLCIKEYRLKNKDKIKQKVKRYYLQNIESITEYQRVYHIKNNQKLDVKIKRAARERARIQVDPLFKISHRLRTRIYQALKGNFKSGSAVRDLGCSIDQLKEYIEIKFKPGMTWDNYGMWHLDHINPLSNFDLSNREEFLKAAHYTNLQPLWAIDNIKKSNKVVDYDGVL